ncbi:MAG: hypothetical protein HY554_02715 [Elusimicrobia bacterium]|nr:hypothetical protein [Elusimicrobiota bacterium]
MILLTAATPWEAKPLARRWGLALERAPGPGRLYAGRVAGRELRLAQTGMGSAKTAAALQALEAGDASAPAAVASVGLAGALQPGVRAGELVADLRGAPLDWLQAARETAGELRMPLHLGAIRSADRVLGPREKRELGAAQRAVAVDMETSAVRAWSERRGAVFVGVRAVFDELDERAPEGGPEDDSAGATLRFAASRWAELPRLVRFWPRQAGGMRVVGRFLERWLEILAEGQNLPGQHESTTR